MARDKCIASLILLAASPASAQQWTAIRLHPQGALVSGVTAVSATEQGGGYAPLTGPAAQAGYCRGTANSWILLSPPESNGSVFGMDATQQVGELSGHAVLWRGTPESRVDLHTAPLMWSEARAVRGNMQVGLVRPWGTTGDRAALWGGTAESYVDLHPAGALRSMATATDGVLQGGAVFFGTGQGIPYAAIWNGTAGSVVDVHPPGMFYSGIAGMAPGVQVGSAFDTQGGWPALPVHRASLWRGSAESWTDLTPSGAGGIWQFAATTGRVHVGKGSPAGVGTVHAHVNFGTPEAWTDLHQFLPPEYTQASVATSVYQNGPTINVGGAAVSDATGEYHAFLWIGADPCYPNCDQSTAAPILNVADFTCFLQRFAAGDGYANCDRSTVPPVLNVADFGCFLQQFAVGCP